MSEELHLNPQPPDSLGDQDSDEFEEISSEEVDRVCAALDELMDSIDSENIQAFLEEASNNIFSLVYDESDFDDLEEDAHDEAA